MRTIASANIASVDEETLDAQLNEEASELVGAERYERAAGRETYRSPCPVSTTAPRHAGAAQAPRRAGRERRDGHRSRPAVR